jgi:hypothetical protein
MTSSQRAAMAVSWMEGSPSTEATAPSQQQPESKQAGSAHSSNSDDPESPPEMLETWIIMEVSVQRLLCISGHRFSTRCDHELCWVL